MAIAVAVAIGALALVHVRGARTALAGEPRAAVVGPEFEVRLACASLGRRLSEPSIELRTGLRAAGTVLRVGERARLRADEWRRVEPLALVPGWRLRPGSLGPVCPGGGTGGMRELAIEAVPVHHVLVRVRDEVSGIAVPIYRVRIAWRADDAAAETASPSFPIDDRDGAALFDGVPLARGSVRAEVEAVGYAPFRGPWRRIDSEGWIEMEARLVPR